MDLRLFGLRVHMNEINEPKEVGVHSVIMKRLICLCLSLFWVASTALPLDRLEVLCEVIGRGTY